MLFNYILIKLFTKKIHPQSHPEIFIPLFQMTKVVSIMGTDVGDLNLIINNTDLGVFLRERKTNVQNKDKCSWHRYSQQRTWKQLKHVTN